MCSIDLKVQSAAKINWNLRILGRRADGFHELESLVGTVSFYDELNFRERAGGVIEVTADRPDLPKDRDNLVGQAIRLMMDERGDADRGLSCVIHKQIPVGGGLGGGSSNAAATIRTCNHLWGLNRSNEQLQAIAAKLGSDVPFFLFGGTAVMRGRGERIEPVALPWSGWVLLLLPDLFISTADVYRAWKESGQASSGQAILPHADNAVDWMRQTFNMLEAPAMTVCPPLEAMMNETEGLIGRPVRLSGSGSTFYSAYDDEEEAKSNAALVLRRLGIRTRVVRPVEQAMRTNYDHLAVTSEGFDAR